MINGFDMLAKGEKLLAQGLRKDLLECSAVAFTLRSVASDRFAQISANKRLAEQFPNMAGPCGKELFMTVGCIHTTCFLKSLMFGKIDKNTSSCMQAGHPVHDCIQEGWQWLILSDTLERELPGLPLLYSSVLNNLNAVHVASTEMEYLATLSKLFKMNRSLEEAIEATKQGEPVCKSYLGSIAHFAQRYCGGTEMPMVDFLVGFSALYEYACHEHTWLEMVHDASNKRVHACFARQSVWGILEIGIGIHTSHRTLRFPTRCEPRTVLSHSLCGDPNVVTQGGGWCGENDIQGRP